MGAQTTPVKRPPPHAASASPSPAPPVTPAMTRGRRAADAVAPATPPRGRSGPRRCPAPGERPASVTRPRRPAICSVVHKM